MTATKMKAAVLFETGQPLRVVDGIDVPKPEFGQVQIKVLYSGLCHSQLMEVSGGRGEDKYLPHLLGHEGVGIVESLGDGVNKVEVGDKVGIGWIKGLGQNVGGAKFPHQNYIINSGAATTLSSRTIVAENRVVKLPEGIPDSLAVLLGCALPTGLGLVFNELQPDNDKRIGVFGLGGVGMSALLAARLYSPEMLVAVDVTEEKLNLARQLGATHTINAVKCDPVAEIFKLTDGVGLDYCLEAGGTTQTIEQAFAAVRDGGGQCVFASHPKEGETVNLEPHAFHRGKQIKGSWGGGSQPDEDIKKFVKLYQQGDINLDALISREYSLEDINTALDDMANKRIVRALINTQI
jgi:S-(hydroxymethyl)glutathione dehydrogenase/alcohol dehydrogenase